MDEILDSLEFNSEENEEPINVSTVINNGIERIVVNYALQQNGEKFIKSFCKMYPFDGKEFKPHQVYAGGECEYYETEEE